MKKQIIKIIQKLKIEKPVVTLYFFITKLTTKRNVEFDEDKFKIISFKKGDLKRYDRIPKVVWIFWADPILPAEVNACVSRIKKLNPSYQINLLDKNTINQYIDIDINNEKMPLANISDLIRLKLLKNFGGVWLDATIIMNKPLDWFIDDNQNNIDLIAFYRETSTSNNAYPVLESWFLAAPKESHYINRWLENFQIVESIGSKSYFEMVSNRTDYAEIKQRISPPEYLIVYLANQITMKEIDSCNLKLYLADKSAYIIQDTLGWRAYKTHAYLNILDAPIELSPIYKLTSGDRKYMDIIYKYKLTNSNSIFGKLLKEVD